MYQAVRRAFFLVPAERIHTWVFRGLRTGTAPGATRRTLKKWLAPHDPVLASTVFGARFPAPMGLAAGFDKNGAGLAAWGALGFGYAEVGTVTAQPQPGNPPPRLFRLPDDRALLNRLGFNNDGAGRLAQRLAEHTPDVPIGVNIGKTKVVPAEKAVDDYRESARLVGSLATYLVVNVSSPNTPGPARPAGRRIVAAYPCRGSGGDHHARARQDRTGFVRLRYRRDRRSGGRIGPRRDRRDQHHGVPRRVWRRRGRPSSGQGVSRAPRSRGGRPRCCAGCTPAWATASC